VNEDPGWNLPWKSFSYAFAPRWAVQRAAKQPDSSELTFIRQLFASCSLFLLILTVIFLILLGSVEPQSPQAAILISIVLIQGIFGLILGRHLRRRLDCSSDATLVSSYRTLFFCRVYIGLGVAVTSFAFSLRLGPKWVYPIGLGLAIAGMVISAPTRRRLNSEQNDLSSNGCHLSLIRALASQPVQGIG